MVYEKFEILFRYWLKSMKKDTEYSFYSLVDGGYGDSAQIHRFKLLMMVDKIRIYLFYSRHFIILLNYSSQ